MWIIVLHMKWRGISVAAVAKEIGRPTATLEARLKER
jgi:hypothetical protein